jgi:hypothetical protein
VTRYASANAKVKALKDKENISVRCCRIFACCTARAGDAHAGDVSAGDRFLFSGHKIGYINERVFRYDTNEYLLLTVPLPFECETLPRRRFRWRDSPERRYSAAAGAADGYWRR